MLLNAGRRRHEPRVGVDQVHNYYEHLVLEEITLTNERSRTDLDFLADVACVALNRLPPRYVRHDVDLTFFMSPLELQNMQEKIQSAVKQAIDYVVSRDRQKVADDEEQA
ncbi:hypothetical protein FKG94_24890 [Exilibacterium tricleocarpae]|uniref:Competence protein ComFB n=1 Tax=Exilibacterium tricleocarpae TaxID=2591008 RepID=A0A545SS14_9GAMM|nr:late competence development ComFB family protein [Exilibacterium tricleocarpae]TQV67770.1 hypothetical protein FKG94_24890 [Exilibacterium tricleocarpae]